MPRTKRPARQQENKAERDDALKTFDKIVNDQKKQIDSCVQMECRQIELAFKILLSSISKANLDKTVGQLKTELNLKDYPSVEKKNTSSRSASHDDGYHTENSQSSTSSGKRSKFACPTTQSRSTSRRSRSADTHRKQMSTIKKPAPPSRSRSVYRTPMCNKTMNMMPAITPKVCPETPLTLLRQPRMGEMVFSTSGSPVMVPTYSTMKRDEKANCNIMLEDGTMLSLQPKHLRQSQSFIPYSLMDGDVLEQLKTLRKNLDTIVKQGEKAIK